MEWDTRVWSFFIWIVATCLFLGGFCTPYSKIGNRVGVHVSFGGLLEPGQPKFGLWGDNSGHEFMGAIQGLLCVTLLMVVLTLVFYFVLFKRTAHVIQILAFVTQLLGGIFAIVGAVVFRVNSDELAEGFWMIATSGPLYVVNAIVLVFMPIMEYQPPKWITHEDENDESGIPLTKGAAVYGHA